MNNLNKKISVEITTGTIIRVIIVLGVIVFLYIIMDVVVILFFSILLILILQPPVNWLHKFKIPRPLGVLIIYLLLIALLSLVVILIIPPIATQISQVTQALGEYWNYISGYFGLPAIQADLSGLQSALSDYQKYFSLATENIFSTLTGVLGSVISLFIVLVVSFYGLVEEKAFRRVLRSIVPSDYQPYLYHVANRIQKKLGQWIRGQLLLGFIVFLLVYIGLTILGVEYALVLALVSGILEFIPYIGPIVSGVLGVFLTIFVSPIKALLVLVLYIIIQQAENHILVPKIMQRTTGLNPVVSIVALLIGGKLGGVIGLILAIPVALAVSVFIQDFVDKKTADQLSIQE